jgi:LytS/YehU family sensor histidine kinase
LISNYLEIEKARFEDRLRVSYQIAEGLRSKRIPSLILQPLVENAIKHGIAELSHGGEVIIAADEITSDGKRRLRLSVRNTAAPRKKPTDGGGHGLANIRQRLAAYYDGESQFSLTPDGQGGMVAEILLPLSAAGRRAA